MASKVPNSTCFRLLRQSSRLNSQDAYTFAESPYYLTCRTSALANPLQSRRSASTTSTPESATTPPNSTSSRKSKSKSTTLPPPSTPSSSTSPVAGLAQALRSRARQTTDTYVAYGVTQKLFEACSSQADYTIPQVTEKGAEVPKTADGEDLGVGEGWWYKDLGFKPTFSTWSQVTFLHMYLLTVRLRALDSPESLQTYSRHLLDHFSHRAEDRMTVLHGMDVRGMRNKYLKDLFLQWRGVLAAYDEGLIRGDAVLGAAIWRNLWKGSDVGPDGQEVDWEKVARVVAYMRRVLADLGKVQDGDLMFAVTGLYQEKKSGGLFGYNERDRHLVEARSLGINEPFKEEDSGEGKQESS
ncbi:Protein cbp3, mitochondrial [Arachnomyces sp. PD_36]|nr:Protein cbp3, mitochondrial [Arachnomyces sp. PD_36]